MGRIFLLLGLLCNVAFVMPNVGDYAMYSLEYDHDTHMEYEFLTKEILSHDSSEDTFLLEIVKWDRHGNVISMNKEWKPRSWFLSTAQAQHMVKNCENFGAMEWSVRVPAGVFMTCRFEREDKNHYKWMGNVPFGLVQLSEVRADGVHLRWILREISK